MTMMVNGQRIESDGYEFGMRRPDGYVVPCDSMEDAQNLCSKIIGGAVVFRAVYVTPWMETEGDDNPPKKTD